MLPAAVLAAVGVGADTGATVPVFVLPAATAAVLLLPLLPLFCCEE